MIDRSILKECARFYAKPGMFEAPDPSGTGSGFVPPVVYVYCETCGASVPYIAERLIGRAPLKAILKGEANR